MEIPKNAKKIEVCGFSFYAVREKMGYMGSTCYGAFSQYSENFGWSIFNDKGAFVMGGTSRMHGITYNTFKSIQMNFLGDSESRYEVYSKYEMKGVPFSIYD